MIILFLSAERENRQFGVEATSVYAVAEGKPGHTCISYTDHGGDTHSHHVAEPIETVARKINEARGER